MTNKRIKQRWKKIRQWKYCPDCQQKMKKECGICRKLICPNCDLGLEYNTDYGLIHKTCLIINPLPLQEVTIDVVDNLPPMEKSKVLAVRYDWLRRQRKQDKKEIATRKGRIYRTTHRKFWLEQGRCPQCEGHDIIFKAHKCLLCYGKDIKRHREEGAERKKLHEIKKEKERRQRKKRKRK